MMLHKPLLNTIEIDGVRCSVNLAFNRVLDAVELLNSNEWTATDAYDILFDWFVESDIEFSAEQRIEAVSQIVHNWLYSDSGKDGEQTISFEQDAPYIYAAFLQAYGINLFDYHDILQWWEFKALLSSLPADTKMAEIIDIRTRTIPPLTKHNGEYVRKLMALKTEYAITATDSQSAWGKLFDVLDRQAGD